MRVVVSAGGTGGHIYPAIAVINKIKDLEPNSEILYIGTHNRMEKDLIPKYDINYYPLTVTGLKRKLSFDNIKTLYQFVTSINHAKSVIDDFNPDVVIGFGGYVTAPVIIAAKRLGIPTFIHEQNSVVGLANKLLGKIATSVGVSFDNTLSEFGKKAFISGNPCSEVALHQKPTNHKLFNNNNPVVIMACGSLGSGSINKTMIKLLPKLSDKPYNFLYVSGKGYYQDFANLKTPDNVKIIPYLDDAVGYLKKADLFVSRAGATTISEVAVIGIPTIFIPSPYVTANHQFKNADSLVKHNAALMLQEADFSETSFIKLLDNTLANQALLKSLSKNLKKLGVKDSATRIYQKLCEIKK